MGALDPLLFLKSTRRVRIRWPVEQRQYRQCCRRKVVDSTLHPLSLSGPAGLTCANQVDCTNEEIRAEIIVVVIHGGLPPLARDCRPLMPTFCVERSMWFVGPEGFPFGGFLHSVSR